MKKIVPNQYHLVQIVNIELKKIIFLAKSKTSVFAAVFCSLIALVIIAFIMYKFGVINVIYNKIFIKTRGYTQVGNNHVYDCDNNSGLLSDNNDDSNDDEFYY